MGRELDGTRYGPVKVYADDQALEERLLDLRSPRILHIATHGFFLPDEPLHPQKVPTAAGAGKPGSFPAERSISLGRSHTE